MDMGAQYIGGIDTYATRFRLTSPRCRIRFGGSSEFFHETQLNRPYLSFLLLLGFVAFNAALLIGLFASPRPPQA